MGGGQTIAVTGLLNNYGTIYAKMTPEGDGYQVDNVTGYTNTGITITGTCGGYINECSCSEYGIIPKVVNGSGTTYYTDRCYFKNDQFGWCTISELPSPDYQAGAFAVWLGYKVEEAYSTSGAGLSCEMPAA